MGLLCPLKASNLLLKCVLLKIQSFVTVSKYLCPETAQVALDELAEAFSPLTVVFLLSPINLNSLLKLKVNVDLNMGILVLWKSF